MLSSKMSLAIDLGFLKKKGGGACYLYFNIVVFSKLQTTKRI